MLDKDILYIGVNDKDIDLFEGQFVVENGMAYNSYIINDEKIAVFDTVDKNFVDEWLNNIEKSLGEKEPDYLIVQHVEPDHSAGILSFVSKYKNAKVVATNQALTMINNYYHVNNSEKLIAVKDGQTFSLGRHQLTFYTAPMVHWPEVMLTLDATTSTLFSADAFGKFGALDTDEDWACEARRYYFGIVGKYGANVQALLKKLSNVEIKTICPLHGPILTENLGYYLDLYNTWSSYTPEAKGVVICYTSVYGNTKKAVDLLQSKLIEKGVKVSVFDLARNDMAEAVEDAFKYDRLVLATTTYNSDIFPFMRTFIEALKERNYKNRTIAFIENGSWAPLATKVMKGLLENQKDITYTENNVKILSSLNEESTAQVISLAEELSK